MKFVLLVRVPPDAQPTPEEADPTAWVDDAVRRELWLEGHRLQGTSDATTVRVRDGKILVTDGPFAEFKEHIAGFDVIEAAGLDDAVALAQGHPMARFGAIEVREVWAEFERAEHSRKR
jgi:hypothetical protein